MKKIYLLFSLWLITCAGYTQVVVATLANPVPVPYTTLKAAFDAINAGTHTGSIQVEVVGNTTETASAILNASGVGGANYSVVGVVPSAVGDKIISGNIDGPLVELNGTDSVLFYGQNRLTFINLSTSGSGNISTFRFVNGASTNAIVQSTILGAGTNATSGTILFSEGATVGNSFNLILNNNIGDANGSFPVNAVYSQGLTGGGTENTSDTLRGNNIYNFFHPSVSSAGVLIGAGNTSWDITGNRFYQTTPQVFTTGNPHRVIQITSGSRHVIAGNTIGYSSATGTGTYTIEGAVTTRFLAIDLAVGTAAPTMVLANSISNMQYTTSNSSSSASGIWCAVNITAGNVNVTGNTIGSTTGTGNISIVPTVAGTLTVPITTSSPGIINITDNTIGGISVTPTGVLSGNMSGIQVQGTSATVTVMNNIIGNTTAQNMRIGTLGATTGNGIIRGINCSNAGTTNLLHNTVRNLVHFSTNQLSLFRGIEMQMGTGLISGNNITDVTAYGTSVSALTAEGSGIQVTSSVPNVVIDSNYISRLSIMNSTTATGGVVAGIYLGSSVNGTAITRNQLYDFRNASTSVSTTVPGVAVGIYLRDANVASPLLIANNMISLGNGQATNTAFIGIWNLVSSAAPGYIANIYHNSVNIEGTVAAGEQPSFAYYRGNFSTTTFTGPNVNIRNNIFTNSRTGGTGKHYAIANSYGATASSSTGWGTNASDYNILNANPATVGYWSGDQTFSGWQLASASDEHSYSNVAVVYVNSASDLHLVTTTGTNAAADGKGIPIAVITHDIDGQVRDAVTPDLGADEIIAGPVSISIEYFKGSKQTSSNVLQWKAGCSSNSVTFDIERSNDSRKFTSIGKFTATQARCASPFGFTDVAPKPGINYYRLKMTEIDGQVTFSFIIAIINKSKGFEMVNMLPTVVDKGSAILNVTTAQRDQLQLVVTDISGKVMSKQTTSLSEGSNTIQLNLSYLSAGMYQLTGYTAEGISKTIRFVKQ